LLFYGPPGTGKTSTIVACAKYMYGRDYGMMVLELNASDARGIDVVRDIIKTFAETQVPFSKSEYTIKLIILDEADAMTRDAQAALRRIMEKYSRTTRFCMICNYVRQMLKLGF
jgi:replication factor C subunit 3/5